MKPLSVKEENMEAVRRRDLFIMLTLEDRIYTIADIEALPEGQRAELQER